MDHVTNLFAALEEATARAQEGRFGQDGLADIEVEGASADELVRVQLGGGRATGVDIDVRAMRRSNAELADLVLEAINAAMEEYTKRVTEAMQDSSTDFGALKAELTESSAEAHRVLMAQAQQMKEILAKVGERYQPGSGA